MRIPLMSYRSFVYRSRELIHSINSSTSIRYNNTVCRKGRRSVDREDHFKAGRYAIHRRMHVACLRSTSIHYPHELLFWKELG